MKIFLDPIKRIYAGLACIWYFLGGCGSILIRSMFGKATRDTTNNSLKKRSIKILNAVKAEYKATYEEGFKYLENMPRIFMSNHVSLFDTPLFYATMPHTIRVITKKELTKIPFFGKGIIDAEQIIIDRKVPAASQNFYQNAKEKLAKGISIWIFSEGTRSANGELLPLKPGGFRLACEAGAQIIPVGVVGTGDILKTQKTLPHLNKSIELRVGSPIDTSDYKSSEKLKDLMERVAGMIRKLSCHPEKRSDEGSP